MKWLHSPPTSMWWRIQWLLEQVDATVLIHIWVPAILPITAFTSVQMSTHPKRYKMSHCVCVNHSVMSNSLWPHGLYVVLQTPLSMGILQARILKWVAISFSRGSSWPRDRIWVSSITNRFFTIWATTEEQNVSLLLQK